MNKEATNVMHFKSLQFVTPRTHNARMDMVVFEDYYNMTIMDEKVY